MVKHGRDKKRRAGRIGKTKLKVCYRNPDFFTCAGIEKHQDLNALAIIYVTGRIAHTNGGILIQSSVIARLPNYGMYQNLLQ